MILAGSLPCIYNIVVFENLFIICSGGGAIRHFSPAHCNRFPTAKVAAVYQAQYNVVIDGIELLRLPSEKGSYAL